MVRNILEFLENSAERFPGNKAVTEYDQSVTYSELLDMSRRIGSSLAGNVRQGMPVGVFAEKGIKALSAFFGIVQAGGCYALLNPELPDPRLESIQTVLCTETVLTTEDLRERAEKLFPGLRIITVEEAVKCEVNEEFLRDARERAVDTDPLYINFTSGSTGVPKGIAVAHRSVIEFISCFTELFHITGEDVIANQAPFDFDVSVKDIYSALYTGAELVVVPRALFSRPAELIDYLCDHQVTTMIWAVSALCLITTFHGLEYKTPKTVNKILFSGEVMPYKHLSQWQKYLPDAMYVNLYGPTEITCNCTYHILEKGRDYSSGIPIGKHFPNEDVFLLNEQNEKITEPGITGKLLVRGTALALGYYRMPEKNAEAFIQNPLNDVYPETVYVTGDLGMYNEEGELVFCGRADNQVKYMGHRIELEEIEKAMAAVPGVERCVVLFDEKRSRLKGYYTGTVEKNELSSVMKETLPVFMVPGFIRKLDEFPLTKNGKIDRKQLDVKKTGAGK